MLKSHSLVPCCVPRNRKFYLRQLYPLKLETYGRYSGTDIDLGLRDDPAKLPGNLKMSGTEIDHDGITLPRILSKHQK